MLLWTYCRLATCAKPFLKVVVIIAVAATRLKRFFRSEYFLYESFSFHISSEFVNSSVEGKTSSFFPENVYSLKFR